MLNFSEFLILENQEKLFKKYNITYKGTGSTGLDEEKNIWYGWSHRAICGFEIGDMIFDEKFGTDTTLFKQHGSKKCKSISDCKQAAENFSKYVS